MAFPVNTVCVVDVLINLLKKSVLSGHVALGCPTPFFLQQTFYCLYIENWITMKFPLPLWQHVKNWSEIKESIHIIEVYIDKQYPTPPNGLGFAKLLFWIMNFWISLPFNSFKNEATMRAWKKAATRMEFYLWKTFEIDITVENRTFFNSETIRR